MTAQSKSFPSLGMLVNTFNDWLKHRRELNELLALGLNPKNPNRNDGSEHG
jgi:uncharacterized protein YjiS (DUF1127 family)